MKITYVVSTFPKLSETFILGQITDLIDRGHDVEIVSIHKPNEESVHEDVEKYKLLEKTHYIHKTPSGLGFRPDEKLISSLIFTDIIHAHFAASPAYWASIFSRYFGVPFVITTHAYDIYINPDVEDLRAKFDHAAKVIATTDYNKDYLSKLLGEGYGANIEVIRYGIDISRFSAIERKPDSVVKILFIGRLVEKKGPSYAIESFRRVMGEIPDIELRMIGDGPLKDEIIDLINKSSLDGKVILLGAQPQSVVLKEMSEADIFFLPSMTAENGDREGSPVSILEAEATGLPIVSTVHTGIPEIVIDGKTGFLSPEKDTVAMTERLKELILDPELRIRMGKAGRDHVESHYDRKMETDYLIKLFDDLLGGRTLISDISETRLGVIRERIHNLSVMLSELDDEIRGKGKEITRMNKDLDQKDEQTRNMQERLQNIENSLAYKAYLNVAKMYGYLRQKL
jgi:colanic acid/amylovoran biosynthesis glycosyltransferase